MRPVKVHSIAYAIYGGMDDAPIDGNMSIVKKAMGLSFSLEVGIAVRQSADNAGKCIEAYAYLSINCWLAQRVKKVLVVEV